MLWRLRSQRVIIIMIIIGPMLFMMYVSPIDDGVCTRQMQYRQYANVGL